MSNIDKDIEILEELITHKDDYDVAYGYRFEKPCQIGSEKINAIENVLADRETWKKTAEKLAEDKIIPKCKNCSDEDTHECTECALEWARKEVESEEV